VQRLIAAVALVLALGACASAPRAPEPSREMPLLRLEPSFRGPGSLNLQQHLTLQAPGRDQQLDVLLEADARHVRLAVLAAGQVAARLDWDGVTLTEQHAPWWPQAISGARILSDLQLTLWPVVVVQSALPGGWRLAESGNVRTLTQDGEVVCVITRMSAQVVELDQRREHFKLKIESRDLSDPAP
jgi:Protein of unknown function (DUF3261)